MLENVFSDDQKLTIKKRHSFYTAHTPETSCSREFCKSEMHISTNNSPKMAVDNNRTKCKENFDQYYKKYEHDTMPVRDDTSYTISQNSGDNKNSITNSEIDRIEMRILRKMSQELQTDDSSVDTLDSNIKIFKTTVQQIFRNFYESTQDYELYKQKFNEILEKNRGDSVIEMESFIKELINHIGSSESSGSDIDKRIKHIDITNTTLETFKNDNYLTDSTFDNESSKCNTDAKKEDTVNIYLVGGTPYLEIKMTDRSLFSEINIRHKHLESIKELASAENIKKVAAKNLELQKYAQQEHISLKDRNIPVKSSCARKNMLDEESDSDKDDGNKFFIFKICNYICRKIRKNAFG